MRVFAINTGVARQIHYRGRLVSTGIYKTPVEGPVMVHAEGFSGDVQVDRDHHGGPDKAVYAYTRENHRYWAAARREPDYPPGQFGENLTVTGMPDETVHIGDIFRIGASLMQVTQPRVPCYKLGVKFGDAGLVGEFLVSGRTGFYLRVLEAGIVQAGDPITLFAPDPSQVCIRDAMKALQHGPQRRSWIGRVLSLEALSDAWRADLTKRLNADPP